MGELDEDNHHPEHDENEVEKLDKIDNEVTIEQHEDDELRLEEIVDEMFELINLMVETEAELIDGEDEDDGGDEMEVYEMVAEMMISELVDEVDMLYQQHLIEFLLSDEVVPHEIIEV